MNTLLFFLICFTCCYASSSTKITTSVQLYGGWCKLCDYPDYHYACSNGHGDWNDGYFTFKDPLPSGNVLTEIRLTLHGQWSCAGPFSTASVSIQDNFLFVKDTLDTVHTLEGSCVCGTCTFPGEYEWQEFGKCFPNYNYGGDNTIHIDVPTGLICVAEIEIELTFSPGNPLTCGCGSYGDCQYRNMRCVGENSYQTCTMDHNGSTYWGSVQLCRENHFCNATGDYIYCIEHAQNQCTAGQMRCVDSNTFQTCHTDINGNKYWGTSETCYTGSVCNPDPCGHTVLCVPDNVVNVSETCIPRSMRCVSDNSYQMCHTNENGVGAWNPVQLCGENHICVTHGEVIYCEKQELQFQSICTLGHMRCVDSETYQVCDRDRNGDTFWNVFQTCQPGLTCHPHGDYIYCY